MAVDFTENKTQSTKDSWTSNSRDILFNVHFLGDRESTYLYQGQSTPYILGD